MFKKFEVWKIFFCMFTFTRILELHDLYNFDLQEL